MDMARTGPDRGMKRKGTSQTFLLKSTGERRCDPGVSGNASSHTFCIQYRVYTLSL
jgi:hypothetical protein